MKVTPIRSHTSTKPASSDTNPQPGQQASTLPAIIAPFQLRVIQVRAAQVALVPQQHTLVGQPDEQRTALAARCAGR